MEFKFYIGDCQEAKALISETQEAIQKFHAECAAVADEYGAEGCAFMNGKPSCLVFKSEPESAFLKVSSQRGGEYYCHPRLNFKEGKALSSKLSAIQKVAPSDFIVDRLGVCRHVAGRHFGSQTGMALYRSVAGYNSGKLIVKIPAGDGGDKMPIVPEWLTEVKESEFLAAQGK